jgi:uncharacterized protein YjiS (DUF1127 family)
MNTVIGARQQSLSPAVNARFQILWRATSMATRLLHTRRTTAALYALPDYVLKDIGMSRCEILSVLRFRELDPTRRERHQEV